MKNIELIIPSLEEYYYEKQVNEDPLSMDYNAGYNVSYYGYHYDTGCIDFPKERWQEVYNKRIKENKYFAYIKDIDTNNYVGYVNYQYNKENNRYECGILIEEKHRGKGYSYPALLKLCKVAFDNNIEELYDNFESSRKEALKTFKKVGFKVVEETSWKKFDKEVDGVIIKLTKEDYTNQKNI